MNNNLSHLYVSTDSEARIALWVFDLDGNILATNTPYRVIEISSWKEVRIPAYQLDNDANLISWPSAPYRWLENFEDSLVHFQDYSKYSEPNHLIDDTLEAIKNESFSPSFQAFKETFLIPARLFAIITARGHSADNLERAIRLISETVLNEKEKAIQYENIKKLYTHLYPELPIPNRDEAVVLYFREIISYYTVSNPHIMKYLNLKKNTNIPNKKVLCLAHYIQDVLNRILKPVWIQDSWLAIGFSDDSAKNMSAMLDYFIERRRNGSLENNTVHLYFTGKQWQLPIPEESCISIEKMEDMTIIQV